MRHCGKPAIALRLLAGPILVFLTICGVLVTIASSQTKEEQIGQALIKAHDNTSFPLVGGHRDVECGACHLKGVIGGTPESCEACHWTRKQDDPYQLQLGMQCAKCHTPESWKMLASSTWNHETETGFRLDGGHGALECAQCHTSGSFGGVTTECYVCHSSQFQTAKRPDHTAAGFPTDCELCHVGGGQWEGADFEHTSFTLNGQHAVADCALCHPNGQYTGTPSTCASCHLSDYQATTNPNHQQAGFSTDCETCHGAAASSWQGATFDHSLVFPLNGQHAVTD